jgi:cyanophycinase
MYSVNSKKQLNFSAMAEQISEKSSGECPVPSGILVIIGGKENKGEQSEKEINSDNVVPLEVLKTFVDVIPKKNAVVEVITSASGEGNESFKEYKSLFNKLKIQDVRHMHHNTREEVLSDDVTKRAAEADAFFFSGGDQLKLTALYGGAPFLTELKKRYIRENIVVGGTSAGAMALSTPMIISGNNEINSEIKVTTGLEFIKDVCIDTHFIKRGRFARMAQVVATNPTCIGIGIEEDTAIILRNGVDATIIGSGSITVIDGFHITGSNIVTYDEHNAIAIRNLKVHLLSRDDTYKVPQINPPHK